MDKKKYIEPTTHYQSLEGILLWGPKAGSDGGGMPNPVSRRWTDVF